MKINEKLISDKYDVRKLTEEDVDDIFNLCIGNPLYYEYCPPLITKEHILDDMTMLPPNVDISDKYYIGFYHENQLIAIMDLINGYPSKSVAFIGFFMTDQSVQSSGVGTGIIQKLCTYLKTLGFYSVQLAWVKGNPQAEHFWLKNGFIKIKETSSTAADSVILSEKVL